LPSHTWTPSVEQLCAIAMLIEAKVAHEIDLIGHRLNWLIYSEAFLFTGFITIFLVPPQSPVAVDVQLLWWLLPVIGLLLVAAIGPSLFAATKVARALLVARSVIEQKLRADGFDELPILGLDRAGDLKWTPTWGALPQKALPIGIVVLWGLLLAIRFRIELR
jgi:hypothetical protein